VAQKELAHRRPVVAIGGEGAGQAAFLHFGEDVGEERLGEGLVGLCDTRGS